MLELYKTIWRNTARYQWTIILLTLAIAALAAVPLDYQKTIINEMSAGADFERLLGLGIEMAGVILLSLTLKAFLGYRTQLVGEQVIRLLRKLGLNRVRSDDVSEQAEASRGTLANIVSSESEEVGKFVGGAISEPLLQLGTLISVIGYIAVMQPILGLVILGMIAPQVILVLGIQNRVNALVGERVITLRRTISTVTRSDLIDARQRLLEDFDGLYETRRRIFVWKVSLKLLLGILNGAGLVVVLVYGGWLVSQGQSDVGTIVAATVGLGRIQGPWKDLVGFFRSLSVVQVQYTLLRDFMAFRGQPATQ